MDTKNLSSISFNVVEEDELEAEDQDSGWRAKRETSSRIERPYSRFRRVAKAVMNNNLWTKKQQQMVANEEQINMMEDEEEHYDQVSKFKPQVYGRFATQKSILKLADKLLFTKPRNLRTDEDLEAIHRAICGISAFKKYPHHVQRELGNRLYYEKYEDGRIIIQQGNEAISLYFIIRGSVLVETATIDPFTGRMYRQITSELTAGGSFGEMALLKNSVRESTVICKGDSEFLRIDKEDFQRVLQNSLQKETQRKISIMESCPVFRGWFIKELKAISSTTDIREMPQNTVVVPSLQAHMGSIHVILQGSCNAVCKLKVVKEKLPLGRERVRMVSDEYKYDYLDNDLRSVREVFLVTRTLSAGEFFGIGEDLPNTSIVSATNIEVLTIPTIQLMRHDRAAVLEQLRQEEMEKYPTKVQAFKSFLTQRNWRDFKTRMQRQIRVERRLSNANSSQSFFSRDSSLILDEALHTLTTTPRKSKNRGRDTRLSKRSQSDMGTGRDINLPTINPRLSIVSSSCGEDADLQDYNATQRNARRSALTF